MPKVKNAPPVDESPDVLRANRFRDEAQREALELLDFREQYLRDNTPSPTQRVTAFIKKYICD
jgi:hypothetical protein